PQPDPPALGGLLPPARALAPSARGRQPPLGPPLPDRDHPGPQLLEPHGAPLHTAGRPDARPLAQPPRRRARPVSAQVPGHPKQLAPLPSWLEGMTQEAGSLVPGSI